MGIPEYVYEQEEQEGKQERVVYSSGEEEEITYAVPVSGQLEEDEEDKEPLYLTIDPQQKPKIIKIKFKKN